MDNQQSHQSPSSSAAKPSTSGSSGSQQQQEASPLLLSKAKVSELAREVDPTLQLDEDVEEVLAQMVDEYVDKVLNGSCKMAKHRHSNVLEVKDVEFYLERQQDMWVPGFGTDELKPYKRSCVTEAHKQRLALIRRALKKY